MKKISVLFLLITVAVACEKDFVEEPNAMKEGQLLTRATDSEETYYYWYKGEKIPLTIDKSYVNVIMDAETLKSSKYSKLTQQFEIQQQDGKNSSDLVKLKFRSTPVTTTEYSEIIDLLRQNGQVKYVLPFFERDEGFEPIGTTHIFYLKLKQVGDIAILSDTAQQRGVNIVKGIPYMPLWYILSIRDSDFANSIDASNWFYETGKFADVDPAFMFNFTVSAIEDNDPMFNQQWGLNNLRYPGIDIDAERAWNISTGKGVTVAIVDKGVKYDHPELAENLLPVSFDANYGEEKSPNYLTWGEHGTQVAGIVAAAKNGSQIIGVAYDAKILAVAHDFSPYYESEMETFSSELAGGISWAWQNGADVINCSWGTQRNPDPMRGTCLEEAILDAMALGREVDGKKKGCVVVFAAGNEQVSTISYPANIHDDILTVGGIKYMGIRDENYSNYGTKLDVVAPGTGIVTITRAHSTISANGTSAAAPHVAGIAALILSVHPEYTQKQVVEAIEASAQKIGGYGYSVYSGRPNGTWNSEMGYGLVNAYRALTQRAPCYQSFNYWTVQGYQEREGCEIELSNVTVKNGATLILKAPTITIHEGFEVEAGGSFVFGE